VGNQAKANPFRFSTKFFDEENSLVYFGLRVFNPNLGRWISRDPEEENAGNNLYAFVANSTLSSTDPLGAFTLAEGGAAAGAEGSMMAQGLGAAAQAWSFYNRVRNAVDAYDYLQQTTEKLMKAADTGNLSTEDAADMLLGAAQLFSGMLKGGTSRSAVSWIKEGEKQINKAVKKQIKDAERLLRTDKKFRDWFHKQFKKRMPKDTGKTTNRDLSGLELVEAMLEYYGL
jgi:RHS repeat-associated protein